MLIFFKIFQQASILTTNNTSPQKLQQCTNYSILNTDGTFQKCADSCTYYIPNTNNCYESQNMDGCINASKRSDGTYYCLQSPCYANYLYYKPVFLSPLGICTQQCNNTEGFIFSNLLNLTCDISCPQDSCFSLQILPETNYLILVCQNQSNFTYPSTMMGHFLRDSNNKVFEAKFIQCQKSCHEVHLYSDLYNGGPTPFMLGKVYLFHDQTCVTDAACQFYVQEEVTELSGSKFNASLCVENSTQQCSTYINVSTSVQQYYCTNQTQDYYQSVTDEQMYVQDCNTTSQTVLVNNHKCSAFCDSQYFEVTTNNRGISIYNCVQQCPFPKAVQSGTEINQKIIGSMLHCADDCQKLQELALILKNNTLIYRQNQTCTNSCMFIGVNSSICETPSQNSQFCNTFSQISQIQYQCLEQCNQLRNLVENMGYICQDSCLEEGMYIDNNTCTWDCRESQLYPTFTIYYIDKSVLYCVQDCNNQSESLQIDETYSSTYYKCSPSCESQNMYQHQNKTCTTTCGGLFLNNSKCVQFSECFYKQYYKSTGLQQQENMCGKCTDISTGQYKLDVQNQQQCYNCTKVEYLYPDISNNYYICSNASCQTNTTYNYNNGNQCMQQCPTNKFTYDLNFSCVAKCPSESQYFENLTVTKLTPLKCSNCQGKFIKNDSIVNNTIECVTTVLDCSLQQYITIDPKQYCTDCKNFTSGIQYKTGQCTNCTKANEFIHPSDVNSSKLCSLENCSTELVMVFQNNNTCQNSCEPNFVKSVSNLTCVATCNVYQYQDIKNKQHAVCQESCKIYDYTTSISGVPQCVASCPNPNTFIEINKTCSNTCTSKRFFTNLSCTASVCLYQMVEERDMYRCLEQSEQCPIGSVCRFDCQKFEQNKTCVNQCTNDYAVPVGAIEKGVCDNSCQIFRTQSNTKYCQQKCQNNEFYTKYKSTGRFECSQTCSIGYTNKNINDQLKLAPVCEDQCNFYDKATAIQNVPQCVNACQVLYQGNECVDSCQPNYYINSSSKKCVLNCDSNIYENSTMKCLSSTKDCPYTIVINTLTYCVAKCDKSQFIELTIPKQCVNQCKLKYYDELLNCMDVQQCNTSYQLIDKQNNIQCLKTCPNTFNTIQNDTNTTKTCYQSCPENLTSENHICVPEKLKQNNIGLFAGIAVAVIVVIVIVAITIAIMIRKKKTEHQSNQQVYHDKKQQLEKVQPRKSQNHVPNMSDATFRLQNTSIESNFSNGNNKRVESSDSSPVQQYLWKTRQQQSASQLKQNHTVSQLEVLNTEPNKQEQIEKMSKSKPTEQKTVNDKIMQMKKKAQDNKLQISVLNIAQDQNKSNQNNKPTTYNNSVLQKYMKQAQQQKTQTSHQKNTKGPVNQTALKPKPKPKPKTVIPSEAKQNAMQIIASKNGQI